MTDLSINDLRALSLNYLRQSMRVLAPEADPTPTAMIWLPAVTSPVGLSLVVPSTLAERVEMLNSIRVAVATLSARAVVMIAPGWETVANAEGATRREVVIVTVESREDTGGMTVFPLIRNHATAPVLAPGTWMSASGRAVGQRNEAVTKSPWFGLLTHGATHPSSGARDAGARLARQILSTLAPQAHEPRH